MSTFALDSNSSDEDKVSALNYVLSNLGQGGTGANTANVLTANVTTGVISTQGTTVAYLYQYMNVAYANTATGGSFSSNSANKLYYGIQNTTANVFNTNPADYQWTQVSGGGFGTTKSLFYQTLGGRQIFFNVNTTSPGYYFRSVQDTVPINLDDVTSTQTIFTATVFRRGNVTPATPTGGTYNFGNLFLNPPVGWSANTPPADGNTFVFTSQNTFQSSQDFVVAPSKVWTFPTLFTANGANGATGATGANGAPGTDGISTFDFNAYTLTNFFPNTPLVNSGSWNFATGTGTPPLDPNYIYTPYVLPASTITFNTKYNNNIVKIYTNTVSNVTYPSISNTYYTIFANTYTVGNVLSSYGYYTGTGGINYSTGNVYLDTFTVSGNTAYVDLMLIAAGSDGNVNPTGSGTYTPGRAGNILVASNVALPVGTYQVYHGAGVSTTLTGPGGTWTAPFNSSFNAPGVTIPDPNRLGSFGSNAMVDGVGIIGGAPYPAYTNSYTPYNGGAGFADPWREITWLGQMSGTYTWPNGAPWSGANVAYFGGGGGALINSTNTFYSPPPTASAGGLGNKGPNQLASGQGQVLLNFPTNPYYPLQLNPTYNAYGFDPSVQIQWGAFGTGSGGGATSRAVSSYNLHYNYNPSGPARLNNGYNTYGGTGALIIRKHNTIANPPQIATWTLLNNQTPTPTETVYSSATLAFTTNANATVSTLAWQDTIQSSGFMGDTGPRGFVPMAYVATASDPTSYTTGEYTYSFAANRANVALPIGTGYAPITGDVAQFVYTPTNTIVVKEYNATANVWTQVNGQVISGNVFVTGSVNATALNANDVYTLNLRGGLGVVGDFNSPGFWMQASSGDARMAGNTSIGNNLTVGNNAVIGNSLAIGNNALVGNNLLVGLNAQIGANLNVGTNAIIGNNLSIGNNALVGNNFGVGNIAVIGNNLTVGNNAIIGSSLAIGNNLTVGTNAQIGANLNVGTNATIGNNLLVGNNAVVGDSFGVGNNAVIGNNLTVGNNAIIGSSVAIGNNLNIGNNAVIGGNLAVAGLVTAGNLQANTVQTTTMVPNSATATSGRAGTGYTILTPSIGYAGYDGTWYYYQTVNVVVDSTSISATTNNVTNVISGYIDVWGTTTANGGTTIAPQMYGFLIRSVGGVNTQVPGSFITTPAATGYTGGPITSTQTILPYRLNEVGIIDIFTVTAPATVTYLWVWGAYINVSSNVAPTQNFVQIGSGGYSLTVTNYRR